MPEGLNVQGSTLRAVKNLRSPSNQLHLQAYAKGVRSLAVQIVAGVSSQSRDLHQMRDYVRAAKEGDEVRTFCAFFVPIIRPTARAISTEAHQATFEDVLLRTEKPMRSSMNLASQTKYPEDWTICKTMVRL